MIPEVKVVDAEYLLSGDTPTPLFPEIGVVGRSNAGKSSLINALCERRKLVRTGRTPGQTRRPNFFKVTIKIESGSREEYFLIDFPGYGFASRSLKERTEWAEGLIGFLDNPSRIQRLILVMDARRDVEDAEQEIVAASENREVIIALTKCDKIKRTEFNGRCSAIARALHIGVENVIPTSSASGEGLLELRRRVFSGIERTLG